MNLEIQLNQGGPIFWVLAAATAALGYVALWAVMALPELLGAT